MEFTRTDFRQFIDEVYFLGEQKEFKVLFADRLKKTMLMKPYAKLLKNKRKSYNFVFVNLFKKYNIPHDTIYSQLDKIWKEILIKNEPSLGYKWSEIFHPGYFKIKTMNKIWNSYKKRTLSLANKYGKKNIEK